MFPDPTTNGDEDIKSEAAKSLAKEPDSEPNAGDKGALNPRLAGRSPMDKIPQR